MATCGAHRRRRATLSSLLWCALTVGSGDALDGITPARRSRPAPVVKRARRPPPPDGLAAANAADRRKGGGALEKWEPKIGKRTKKVDCSTAHPSPAMLKHRGGDVTGTRRRCTAPLHGHTRTSSSAPPPSHASRHRRTHRHRHHVGRSVRPRRDPPEAAAAYPMKKAPSTARRRRRREGHRCTRRVKAQFKAAEGGSTGLVIVTASTATAAQRQAHADTRLPPQGCALAARRAAE